MKSGGILALVGILLVSMSILAIGQTVNNPDTFIEATTNTIETLDPQFMLSSATTEISNNVYDSLLDHPHGDLGKLIPSIATTVPSLDNGLITEATDGTTYISFPIREGVKFQDGTILTPEDVVYTFKRGLLVGGQATNYGILSTTLLGATSFSDLVKKLGYDAAYNVLDQAVTTDGHNVTFKLPKPFVPFLGLMSDGGAACGILSKAWCAAQGAWPGTKETGQKYMNQTMEKDPLFNKMMGSGPFKFVSWEPSTRVLLEGFTDYWQGAPKLKQVIRKIVPDGQTAILLLKKGDVDFTTVSVSELGQVEGAPGVKVLKDLPSNWLMKINFVQKIADGSSYIGDGKLGENGIPNDFFSDINVRKAFEYCFDWKTFINDVFLGAALKPYGPVLIGFPTANPDNPQYYLDLDKAKAYFQKAWNGELWKKGFKFTVPYSSGSTHRQRALEILKMNVESINPKFHIELSALPWAAYVGAINNIQLPLSLFGNLPDVFDPYMPLFENMDSAGGYAEWDGYLEQAKKEFDPLINELGSNYDPQRRKEISYKLQKLDYDNALAIWTFQAVEHVAMRDWVKGYYTGPFPFNLDYYPLSKGY